MTLKVLVVLIFLATPAWAQTDPFAVLDALVVKASRGKLSAAEVQTAKDQIARLRADRTIAARLDAIELSLGRLVMDVPPVVTPPSDPPPVVTPPPSTPPPSIPPSTPASSGLLAPSDVKYLGYLTLNAPGADWGGTGAVCITGHRVNGRLRVLMLQSSGAAGGRLDDLDIEGVPFGGTVSSTVRSWPGFVPGASATFAGNHGGCWWEESRGRLWVTFAPRYVTSPVPTMIFTRSIDMATGAIGNVSAPLALQGVGGRQAYGGVQPVPDWFRQKYGVGSYVAGWGGNSSIKSNAVSFGLAMFAFSETGAQSVPAVTLADHSAAAVPPDWYAQGAPTTKDRGWRLDVPINYYDGGDNRPNGSGPGQNLSAPTVPPLPGAQWLSPAPDGKARWVDGDEYGASGAWIDGAKKAFCAVALVNTGKVWYGASDLRSQGRALELHCFDPDALGSNRATPWRVQPMWMIPLPVPPADLAGLSLDNLAGFWDPNDARYYVKVGGTINGARVLVFQLPK